MDGGSTSSNMNNLTWFLNMCMTLTLDQEINFPSLLSRYSLYFSCKSFSWSERVYQTCDFSYLKLNTWKRYLAQILFSFFTCHISSILSQTFVSLTIECDMCKTKSSNIWLRTKIMWRIRPNIGSSFPNHLSRHFSLSNKKSKQTFKSVSRRIACFWISIPFPRGWANEHILIPNLLWSSSAYDDEFKWDFAPTTKAGYWTFIKKE
jgi:hypothetical protein